MSEKELKDSYVYKSLKKGECKKPGNRKFSLWSIGKVTFSFIAATSTIHHSQNICPQLIARLVAHNVDQLPILTLNELLKKNNNNNEDTYKETP